MSGPHLTAWQAYFAENYQQAFAVGEEALRLCRALGEPYTLAIALYSQGLFAATLGKVTDACAWYSECLEA